MLTHKALDISSPLQSRLGRWRRGGGDLTEGGKKRKMLFSGHFRWCLVVAEVMHQMERYNGSRQE